MREGPQSCDWGPGGIVHDVDRSALRGLPDELLQLAPFGLREPHRPTMIVAQDDFFGIGEVDSRAAALNAAQRQHAGFGPGGLFFQIAIHGWILRSYGHQANVQPESGIDKDRL